MVFRPVDSLWVALDMRDVRNQCSEFMTGNPKKISLFEQVQWYYKTYTPEKPFREAQVLYINNKPVGYSIIKTVANQAWLTGGLIPEYRGRGLGKTLFLEMIIRAEAAGKTCWLDVLGYNFRAKSLYEKLGFKTYAIKGNYWDSVLTMRREPRTQECN